MKYLLSLFTCLTCAVVTTAQVHLKNQRFVQVQIGAFDTVLPDKDNLSATVLLGQYNKRVNGNVFGFTYNSKTVRGVVNDLQTGFTVPVRQYYGFFRTDWPLYYNANRTFFVKATGQANLGYESINNEKKFIAERFEVRSPSGFLAGIGVGAEVEFSPVIIGVGSTLNFLSNYQKVNTLPFVAIRYHF